MAKQPIKIKDTPIFEQGGFSVIAGPCAIENKDHLVQTAELLSKLNVKMLRGGAYKLRTSPHSFQGIGKEAVILLSDIAKDYGLFSVTEIISLQDIDLIHKYIDIILVGTRNMYNYPLLKELGQVSCPIILKRGMCATVEEWLLAAEYIDNDKIILCERGIRTFETCTRNTLDLSSAVFVEKKSNFHVITDPSHATGNRDLVIPMALASKACGVQGVMVEIHPEPDKALSDAEQMLDFEMFKELINCTNLVGNAFIRSDINLCKHIILRNG